ncbi:hypothetical protein HPB52_004509 [Rhipicephalus sanguineus]|uniref:Uncharacterized protein n=1 Tax=Rhipicephalus sanguineus TaxID=34632 RepID=A0A9D4Q4W6_RHISA|nr:hypothetical protein HPB52_004509 [Rhipicephalus sanguineus]
MQPVRSSNDLQGLRCLYDTVQSQTRALKYLGVPEDNYSAMLYPILLKSLPHDIVIDFTKTIARQSTQQRGQGGNTGQHSQELKASIQSLLFFIQNEVESRERSVLHISVEENAKMVMLEETQTTEDGQAIAEGLCKELGIGDESLISGSYIDMLPHQPLWQ